MLVWTNSGESQASASVFVEEQCLTLLDSPVDIRVRVSGGGHVSQVYAIRQAIAKSLVAYYAKNFDAASALELRQLFIAYDRTLLIADPRRMEPKKFGGHGARARSEYPAPCLEINRMGADSLTSARTKIIPMKMFAVFLHLIFNLAFHVLTHTIVNVSSTLPARISFHHHSRCRRLYV